MHPWQKTPIRDAVTSYLRDFGPATVRQLAEDLELTVTQVKSCICTARRQTGTDLLRIKSWQREPRHIIPVYELADRPGRNDAPKPRALRSKEKQRRYVNERKTELAIKRRAKNGSQAMPWDGLMA